MLIISFITVRAQEKIPDSASRQQITKLQFLAGEWQGEGWVMKNNGEKLYFKQTEKVQFKLDSTALLVEGLGISQGEVIHNALAIVRSASNEDGYNFYSFLSSNRSGEFRGELIGDKFFWYPDENMRYTIFLNEKGQWYETGEIKRGDTWILFFEMALDKVGGK